MVRLVNKARSAKAVMDLENLGWRVQEFRAVQKEYVRTITTLVTPYVYVLLRHTERSGAYAIATCVVNRRRVGWPDAHSITLKKLEEGGEELLYKWTADKLVASL